MESLLKITPAAVTSKPQNTCVQLFKHNKKHVSHSHKIQIGVSDWQRTLFQIMIQGPKLLTSPRPQVIRESAWRMVCKIFCRAWQWHTSLQSISLIVVTQPHLTLEWDTICCILHALSQPLINEKTVVSFFLKAENQTLRIMKPMNKIFPRAFFLSCVCLDFMSLTPPKEDNKLFKRIFP